MYTVLGTYTMQHPSILAVLCMITHTEGIMHHTVILGDTIDNTTREDTLTEEEIFTDQEVVYTIRMEELP